MSDMVSAVWVVAASATFLLVQFAPSGAVVWAMEKVYALSLIVGIVWCVRAVLPSTRGGKRA